MQDEEEDVGVNREGGEIYEEGKEGEWGKGVGRGSEKKRTRRKAVVHE